jgi:Uma2 family endonuclease
MPELIATRPGLSFDSAKDVTPVDDPVPNRELTYAEFLTFVADKDQRYEYIDGRAVAMGAPSDVHQRLVKRLTIALDAHLDGSRCEVLPAPGLWTVAKRRERVPDLVVFCEGRTPRLVIEILSPDVGIDTTTKVLEYQAIPSIEQYVLVDSGKRWVAVYRRSAERFLVVDTEHIAGTVHLVSIDYVLDVDALYKDVGIRVAP